MMTMKAKVILLVLFVLVVAINVFMILDGCWLEYGGRVIPVAIVITSMRIIKINKSKTNPS